MTKPNLGRVPLDSLRIVGFHDPAGRKKPGTTLKFVTMRAAWVTIGGDSLGRIFVLDALAGRFDPVKMQDILFAQCEKWTPLVYGIEDNAMQAIYADLTMTRARAEGKILPIQAIHQPTNIDKDFRIRQALKPLTAAGRLFVPNKFVELRAEIAGFPSSPQKDLIDALASAVRLLPPPVPVHAVNAEREDRLQYLRESGAHPQYIAEVARGLHD